MDSSNRDLEEFAKMLQADPKLAETLRRREELSEFKERYNLERATPLKCPVCSQWGQTGGSLWINKDDRSVFVCKKCKLSFQIFGLTVPTNILIDQLREAAKTKDEE